ncbi:MAG: sulfatase-like hydrolase/transferase [Thermoanaerobaculaceae bacterium]
MARDSARNLASAKATFLFVGAAATLLSASCGHRTTLQVGDGHLNVLIITLDTIRADRLGAYGNRRVETPFIDGLAARGVLFEECVTAAPLTLPSHTSIFTGTYPIYHGVKDNGDFVVPADLTTMAELFREKGYRTGAFVGAFVLSARWGLNRGFDTYTEPTGASAADILSMGDVRRRGEAVVDDALAWLKQPSTSPFFAWIHLYDLHLPYEPVSPFRERYPNEPYLAEIDYSDAQLARIGAFLESAGLAERTMIIFAGDHGEGLGDHGETDHGLLVYQTTVRVPLIITHPGLQSRGVRRPEVVSLVDLLPTVADATGIRRPAEIQGQSLWSMLGGAGTFRERPVYTETYYPRLHFGWSPLTSLEDRRLQFIDSPEPELYDLATDPEQRRNLLDGKPQLLGEMRQRLNELEVSLGRNAKTATQAPSAETIAKLRSLGYLVGVGSLDRDSQENLPSPRSKLPIYNLLIQAQDALVAGDEPLAEQRIREVLGKDPGVVNAWTMLGGLCHREGRVADAVAAYEEAVRRRPGDPAMSSALATVLLTAGQPEEARRTLEAARSNHPEDPRIYFLLGTVAEEEGRLNDALVLYRKTLALNPLSAPAHVMIGALALRHRDVATAEQELNAALELDPAVAGARFWRGQILEQQGRGEEAIAAYSEELAATPRDLRTAYALAEAYSKLGRSTEQEKTLRDAIDANPTAPVPYLTLAKLYLDRGEHLEDAVRLVEDALKRKPVGPQLALANFLLADLYNRLGDAVRSQEYARRGREAAQASPRRNH